MTLPMNKTKIVATIGPASESPELLEQMILAGMNVARLNFSHGDAESHRLRIENIRRVARSLDRRVAIMVDLPGPKMRIGDLAREPIELQAGDPFTLTIDDIVGDNQRVAVTFQKLPEVVKPGETLYLNDGFIELRVEQVNGPDVECRVLVGGELRSRKGLNLPGIELGISAFTDSDRQHLEFALSQDVDAVSQSFVESAADIEAVRAFAVERGKTPFIIAKIERAAARQAIDEIIAAADGIMVARGDLGVEIPIEQIAVAQKQIIRKANKLGKPVITATQMLETMTEFRRPTRAESTDVANAILDGTDCVMLSGESAVGRYPVDAVKMLARIAASTEPYAERQSARRSLWISREREAQSPEDLVALSVAIMVEKNPPAAIFTPTKSGSSARRIARYRLPLWITAVSRYESVCQELHFSYGVHPIFEAEPPADWEPYTRSWLKQHHIEGDLVLLIEGPSDKNPEANHRLEIIDFVG
ncbi:MAG: pyruvate kinase [bacterium]